MKTTSPFTTLQHIVDILSPQDNRGTLSKKFKNSEVNWDQVVIMASQYLMLPALYCELKRKDLLSDTPPDLLLYLEEITTMNRDRNKSLLIEAKEISSIFNQAQINYVFIKGTAMLAHLASDDVGARMVGDIDIVVQPNQLKHAFQLLETHGYTETIDFNYEPKNFRHLPRQINPDNIGAIELHSEVLLHKYRSHIDVTTLISYKQTVNGLYIPTEEDSIKIAIFTAQINDHGHLFANLNLKILYDCLRLGLHKNRRLLESLSQVTESNSFLELASIYLSALKPSKTISSSQYKKIYYSFKMENPRLGRIVHKTFYSVFEAFERVKLLIENKSYRAHILKNKLKCKLH